MTNYSSLSSLSASQFGFLKWRSCLQQLLVFLDSIHNNLFNKRQTDVIYLEFCKAFDRVPHHLLFLKLQVMGVSGKLLSRLKSYLNSRIQIVSINGHHSTSFRVTSGVPQGRILGPLLFINDLQSLVKSAKLLLFADDTKCQQAISDSNDCQVLQNDLKLLCEWSKTNLSFNDKKSILLRFNPSTSVNYHINNKQIISKDCHRDLGVLISSDLPWSNLYSLIVSKAYKTLVALSVALSPLQQSQQLYLSLVRSQLTYCSSVWKPYLLKDITLLESVQRRTTKWIHNSNYKLRLEKLHLLPLMMILELNDLPFFLKSLVSPSDAFDNRQFINFSPSNRSSAMKLLHHFSKTNFFRNFYFFRLPRFSLQYGSRRHLSSSHPKD